MSLRYLGTETQNGHSPTLWEEDDGWLVIQGFTDLAENSLEKIGTIPPGEAVIRVPKTLMRYLESADGANQ
jgi:hypothetical protein